MSDKIAKTNQQYEEISDEALEMIAGGSNSATVSQSAVALNDGIGAALSSNSSEIKQLEEKNHLFGSHSY